MSEAVYAPTLVLGLVIFDTLDILYQMFEMPCVDEVDVNCPCSSCQEETLQPKLHDTHLPLANDIDFSKTQDGCRHAQPEGGTDCRTAFGLCKRHRKLSLQLLILCVEDKRQDISVYPLAKSYK